MARTLKPRYSQGSLQDATSSLAPGLQHLRGPRSVFPQHRRHEIECMLIRAQRWRATWRTGALDGG